MIKSRSTRRAVVALGLSLLWGCTSPAPRTASSEIDLTGENQEPAEPPPPKPVTCKKDDTGCARAAAEADAKDALPPLDPDKTYDLKIVASDPKKGPDGARVTLVVFSDFQCPFCRHLEVTLAELVLRHPDQVQIVWKDMPLDAHIYARPAALLAREAHARGGDALFWQVHSAIYDKQPELSDATLVQIAAQFSLHWPPLTQYQALLDASYTLGVELNIRATPTTFVNGRPVVGAKPLADFERLVAEELSRPSQSSQNPTSQGAPASAF